LILDFNYLINKAVSSKRTFSGNTIELLAYISKRRNGI